MRAQVEDLIVRVSVLLPELNAENCPTFRVSQLGPCSSHLLTRVEKGGLKVHGLNACGFLCQRKLFQLVLRLLEPFWGRFQGKGNRPEIHGPIS